MSNGLGVGFAALTSLAVLVGLALLAVLVTGGAYLVSRRTGHTLNAFRYLLLAIGVVVLGVSGFSVLALSDEAPALAGLFLLCTVLPGLVSAAYLASATTLSLLDIVATTTMAWGLLFLFGIGVVFGVQRGITSVFDFAPAESRHLGVPWIASTSGGIVLTLGMAVLAIRLSEVMRPPVASPENT